MKQYTIRGVPERLDQCLRRLARKNNTSLNAVVIDLLNAAAGDGEAVIVHHDLDDLGGTWVADPAFDQAMEVFDSVDKGMWK